MSLTERRQATQQALALARGKHAKRADLARQFVILTAAIIAEQIKQKRLEMTREALLREAAFLAGFVNIPADRPCCEANPALWQTWCELTGRQTYHSDLWTEADVVQYIDRLSLEPEQCTRSQS